MIKEPDSVSGVWNKLHETDKYSAFAIDKSGCVVIRDKHYEPGEISEIKTYSFEGSHPADDAVIYVIETHDGTTAYGIDSNGIYYNKMKDEYIGLLRAVNGNDTEKEIVRLISVQLALEKKNRSLAVINADLSNFVNTASHDLMAPLANIELSIRLMGGVKVEDPELKDYIRIIQLSIEKFRRLITDIAEVGLAEGDMLQLQSIDVSEMIDTVEWSLDHSINREHAVINKNIEVKYIMFSRKNLRSIIYNLVSNALKFRNGNSPLITIEVKRADNGVTLTVEDNGIGIPEEHMPRIFDLYGRLHGDIAGKGIGLYLAKKLIDSIDGSISVESEVDKGSRFSIFFPDHK